MAERNEAGDLAPRMREAGFTGRPDGAAALATAALALLPAGAGQAALDLGTGTGDLALSLLAQRPALTVTGIDFAAANIAAAQARDSTVTFVCADYLTWQGGGFDLMVADSVLHLIDAPITHLAAKLAADLAPGGLLVATVPDAVPRNHALMLLRRAYRATPPAMDRLALALATRLYPALSRQALLDRLPYLRILPRLFGRPEHAAFAAAGLWLEAIRPWPSLSLAKPRHRLMVWRRV
jgi:trans-aconitate methyltransferase